jgi:hypothetical protein
MEAPLPLSDTDLFFALYITENARSVNVTLKNRKNNSLLLVQCSLLYKLIEPSLYFDSGIIWVSHSVLTLILDPSSLRARIPRPDCLDLNPGSLP